jgi:hypothetical protein
MTKHQQKPDPPMPLLPKTVSPVRAVHLSTTLGPAPMLSSLSTPRINHISNHFAKFTPTKNNSFPDCTPEPAPNLPELPHPISRTHNEPLNPEKELQKNSSNPRPAPTVSAQQPKMLSSLSTTRMNNIPNYLAKSTPTKNNNFPEFHPNGPQIPKRLRPSGQFHIQPINLIGPNIPGHQNRVIRSHAKGVPENPGVQVAGSAQFSHHLRFAIGQTHPPNREI